ncbi:MAG: hypothetical protein IJ324_03865 [Lachnospiraceae bacterium]|nr:hypothetical protein [Lachnospiraceae bacterium]
MGNILEIRDKLKYLYTKNEVFLLPVLKFMLAFTAICTVSGRLGYMAKVDNLGLILIAALMCSFLPVGCIVFFACVFSLLHLYALSLEVAAVVLVVYLIMFLLFFKFGTKDSLLLLFTAILSAMNIPYVVPIVAGLICGPMSVVSIACGLVVYHLLYNITQNATALSAMNTEEATAKIKMVLNGLVNNDELLVMIVAFSVTVFVVYILRRMSVDYSWTIAMVAGAIVNLMILLVGDLVLDTEVGFLGAFLGTILAIVCAKLLEFFRFCVDYNRTEKVQFEDDEYYYYVKAVPKMTVAEQQKTVKKINAQKASAAGSSYGRAAGTRVETERTGSRTNYYREHASAPKSVTIGHSAMEYEEDEFESLD